MTFLPKLMRPGTRVLALVALSLIALAAANLAPSIPIPSSFQVVADRRWTPRVQTGLGVQRCCRLLVFRGGAQLQRRPQRVRARRRQSHDGLFRHKISALYICCTRHISLALALSRRP